MKSTLAIAVVQHGSIVVILVPWNAELPGGGEGGHSQCT